MQGTKLQDAYACYQALRTISFQDESYRNRTFGQLVYNKFGMTQVGTSIAAQTAASTTHDHYNNCQQVGKYLAEQDLTLEGFKELIQESRKTIRVTKQENQLLRRYQKDKPYGQGLEAYREAGIEYTLIA